MENENTFGLPDENPERILLRKYQNTLSISGIAVIAFGVWSVLKMLIFFSINRDLFTSEIAASSDNEELPLYAVVIALIIFIALYIFLHLYIGLTARSEARGKKRGYFYLILTSVYLVISYISYINTASASSAGDNLDTILSSGIVDLTVIYVFFEVIINSLRVKKLKKKLSESEEQPCR